MANIKLITPEQKYASSYAQALREGLTLYPDDDLKNLTEIETEGFGQWYKNRHDLSRPVTLPNGMQAPRVPQSDFWLVNEDRFLGSAGVRHTLNENLLKTGGHIGYAVRKTERKKGYGKLILQLVLPQAKALGIEKALITCNDDNLGSIKIIEDAGGELENKLDVGFGPLRRRYWITL